MPVKSQDYSHVCVITVDGDLVLADLDAARAPFEQRIASRNIIDYVIDLEKCEFADSAGLEMLLWMKRKAEDLGGQIKLVVATDTLKTIFHITRLALRFETHSELTAALKNM